MRNDFRRLTAWLTLAASAVLGPAAMAACPPDCPLTYGIELTLSSGEGLGADAYASWSLPVGMLGDAPVSIGAAMDVPFVITDRFSALPPEARIYMQATPNVFGYPLDVGVDIRYQRLPGQDIIYGAYVDRFRFSTEGRSWDVSVTLLDLRFNGLFQPPALGFVPILDFATLRVTPVPEPEISLLLLAGLALMAVFVRRRQTMAPRPA